MISRTRGGKVRLALDQAQAMLELGQPELELLEGAA